MGFVIGVLNSVIVVLSIFLVCIILIQRGKGGGLAGAFGGVGGSSAFGTKAGDFFTRLTVGIAIGWICLLMLAVVLTNSMHVSAYDDDSSAALSKEFAPKGTDKAAAETGKAGDVPSAAPTPATGSPTDPAPAINIPAIPDPTPTKPAETPAAKPAASAPAPTPTATPSPAPATSKPAPAAPAATPKKP
jgi:preprotein translocase subunit SecG